MSNEDSTRRAMNIAEGFKRLSGQGLVDLQKALGQTAVTQASLGIRRSITPYGEPYAPLTSRTGTPLRRTGNNIQRCWTAGQYARESFGFGNAFKWIMVHQRGAVIKPVRAKALAFWVEGATAIQHIRNDSRFTKKGREIRGRILVRKGQATQYNRVFARSVTIPARQMVPEDRTGGLGNRWKNAFKRTIATFIQRAFKEQP